MEGTRTVKKVDCYPYLTYQTMDRIAALAHQTGMTQTDCAGKLAVLCLWNKSVLEAVQPYLVMPVSLGWDEDGDTLTVFHPGQKRFAPKHVKDIRLKFRLPQTEAIRLRTLQYGTLAKGRDSLWEILFTSALDKPRVLSLLFPRS